MNKVETIKCLGNEVKMKFNKLLDENSSVDGIIKLLDSNLEEMWTNIAFLDLDDRLLLYDTFLKRGTNFLYLDCLKNNNKLSENSDEEILDNLVYLVRRNLCFYNNNYRAKDGDYFSTYRYCRIASDFIQHIANKQVGVSADMILMNTILDIKDFDHAFNLVVINGNKYIIDSTFSQFLSLYYNSLGTILVGESVNADVGYFLTTSDDKIKLLNQILNRGWFLANEENVKMFFDAFALSNRNGLFYLNNDESLLTTNISGMDYLQAIDNYLNLSEYKLIRILNLNNMKRVNIGKLNELSFYHESFTDDNLNYLLEKINKEKKLLKK